MILFPRFTNYPCVAGLICLPFQQYFSSKWSVYTWWKIYFNVAHIYCTMNSYDQQVKRQVVFQIVGNKVSPVLMSEQWMSYTISSCIKLFLPPLWTPFLQKQLQKHVNRYVSQTIQWPNSVSIIHFMVNVAPVEGATY